MPLTVDQAKTVCERHAQRKGWVPRPNPSVPQSIVLMHPLHAGTLTLSEVASGVVEVVASRRLWMGSVHELGQVLDAQFTEDTANAVRFSHVRSDGQYLSMMMQSFTADSEDLLDAGLEVMADRMLTVFERVLDAVLERFAQSDVPLDPARKAFLHVALAVSELNTVERLGGGLSQESGPARIANVRLPQNEFAVRLRPTRRPLAVEVSEDGVMFNTFLAGLTPADATVDVEDLANRAADLADQHSDIMTGDLLGEPIVVLRKERSLPVSGGDIQAIVKSHASIAAQLRMFDGPGQAS